MGSNLDEPLTPKIYSELQGAYDFFNRRLFDGRLPDALIVLSHHRSAYGYFRSKPFVRRDEVEDAMIFVEAQNEGSDESAALERSRPGIDEISLNIFTFKDRTREQILSTLVHEMVHLEQHHYGKPPKRPSHNKEWGAMMERVGLIPSATGAPGGKRTGRRVSHYIEEGGAFETCVGECEATLDWVGLLTQRRRKKRPKAVYACEPCEVKVRGKPGLHIVCGECGERMPDLNAEDGDEGEES